MRPGARLLFSDALVVNGTITNEELAMRSSIGYYIFVPPGENERLLREAGFTPTSAYDTSQRAAAIALRWREARTKRKDALCRIESERTFEGLQQFLSVVHTVASQHRLARFVYVATAVGNAQ